jgi:folylpolyglutamate synthase/dihydropteroate synthase
VPARFQRWDQRTIIDGAHNPAGARILAETWREMFGDQQATVVLAVLQEKGRGWNLRRTRTGRAPVVAAVDSQ